MDLHLNAEQPTVTEKSAVDGELGPAEARSERDRLLPTLHAIQARIGHITPGAVNYLALRLDVAPAEIHGVASFYGMFSLTPRAPVVAHVCEDIACLARGAASLCAELDKTSMPANATWQRSPCTMARRLSPSGNALSCSQRESVPSGTPIARAAMDWLILAACR